MVGLVFSIMFHAAILLPILIDVATNSAPERFVELASAIEPPAPEPEAEEPVLGIEESMAKTMNWIGYDEYEEHLARLGETDQAEFIMRPSGGGGAPPPTPVSPPSTPPTDPTEPNATAPEQEVVSAKPSLAEPTPPSEQAQIPQAPLKADAEQIETQTAEKSNPDATEGDQPDERTPKKGATETEQEPAEKPTEEAPKPKEPTEEPKEETPQETPPTTPTPPTPKPETDPGKGPGKGAEGDSGESGNAEDRESDATSVVDVPPELWKRGRPLSAQGVELQTKRPFIDTLTQISARFGNPVVEIKFNSKGRPVSAKILVSSGDRRLDEPILDSLYRWRAKGEKLSELKGEDTFDVQLRFVLR